MTLSGIKLSGLAAVLMLAFCVAPSVQAAEKSDNPIANGDFEKGKDGLLSTVLWPPVVGGFVYMFFEMIRSCRHILPRAFVIEESVGVALMSASCTKRVVIA